MFRWFRRIILGLLGAAFLAGVYNLYVQLNEAAEQRHTGYHYQPAANPRLPMALRGQPHSQPYQPYCENPQGHEQATLCAQWATVEQTSEANRLASLSVRLSLIVVILSLFGTAAVVLTFTDQIRTTRRELRAYVFVESMAVHGRRSKEWDPQFRGIPMSQVLIKNNGSTPAFKLVHWGEAEYRLATEEDTLLVPRLQRKMHSNALAPNGISQKTRDVRKLSLEEIAAFKRGELVLYVWGRIEYEDAFGRDHYTNYRLSYTGRWPIPEGGLLNYCAKGNDAN